MRIELPNWGGVIEAQINPVKKLKDAIKALADVLNAARDAYERWLDAGGPDFEGVRAEALKQGLGQPRATGGPVAARKAYMIGERGPELFIPSTSGQIVPNNQLTSPGGGGPNYTINVTAGVGDPVRIGEEVVTAIKRYERASGPVFASA
jgi:hypothetical protein